MPDEVFEPGAETHREPFDRQPFTDDELGRLALSAAPFDPFDPQPFTDDELGRLALSAAPFDPFDDDVLPFRDDRDDLAIDLLPAWYMPAPSLRRDRRRTIVFAVVAIALFTINIAGLCVTYGIPDPVWK